MTMDTPEMDVRQESTDYEVRDYHLWAIVIVTFVAVTAGFAALFLPQVVWGLEPSQTKARDLPQLVFGFIALVVMFTAYVVRQRRALRDARAALLQELLRREEAVRASFVDPLTALFNRRYLEHLAYREAKRADRGGGTFSLLIVDVDNFKAVNDRFGHTEGDRFLKEIAAVLTRSFRETDTVFRHGGDEFLVLLPDTNGQEAQIAANRLEQAQVAWNEANRSTGYRMALSYGIAPYAPGDEVESVLRVADQRMFRQKESRRSHALADADSEGVDQPAPEESAVGQPGHERHERERVEPALHRG